MTVFILGKVKESTPARVNVSMLRWAEKLVKLTESVVDA
jgi:hypothetical protein